MMTNSPLINVWALAIGLMTISRIIIRKVKKHGKINVLQILFESYGISFGMTSNKAHLKIAERILLMFLSIFSIVAGCFCSGFLFQQYSISYFPSAINSIDDLNRTDIPIYVPIEFLNPITLNWFQQQ